MPLQVGPCSWMVNQLTVGTSGTGLFSSGGQLFFQDILNPPISLSSLSPFATGSLQAAYNIASTINVSALQTAVKLTNTGAVVTPLLTVTGNAGVSTTLASFVHPGGSPGFAVQAAATGPTGSAIQGQITGAVNPDAVIVSTVAGVTATGASFRGRNTAGSTLTPILEGTNGATAGVSAAGEFRLRFNNGIPPALEVSFSGAAYIPLASLGAVLAVVAWNMVEKEEFLRVVSHDLSAPLRNIAGMASTLLSRHREQLPPDAVSRLGRIQANIDSEMGLIGELLEFSRLKTRLERRESVDMAALL